MVGVRVAGESDDYHSTIAASIDTMRLLLLSLCRHLRSGIRRMMIAMMLVASLKRSGAQCAPYGHGEWHGDGRDSFAADAAVDVADRKTPA